LFYLFTNTTIQLLYCYICWSFGASEQLGRFDCILVQDEQGNYLVRYVLKEGVPSTVGIAYNA
jgi:hypothetical protein